MANRYQSDDRWGRERSQRGYGRQEEQFDDSSSFAGDRSYNQMGDSWRDYDNQDSSWETVGRGARERERSFGGNTYRSETGGYSRFSGEPRRDYDRYTGSGFQSGDRVRGTDYAGARARETFAAGAGSQLAAAHGEWHDPDDYGHRGYNRTRSYGGNRGDNRNFLERAGDEIAGWFGSDNDGDRRDRGYRGHGPSNYTRSDERIRDDVNDRLTDDWHVDARNINVTVESGEVTLSGTVTSRDQKRRAEDIVEDISGVRHVQNNLRVQDRTGTGGTTGYDPASSGGDTTSGNT